MVSGGQQSKLEYETVWQYEAGIYHRFTKGIDNRFAIYLSDISDYVTIDRKDLLHGQTKNIGWNIDKVTIWGIEYEFNATIKKLNVFGNYSYTETSYEEDDPDKDPGFLVELPPKHKINLSLRYSLTDSLLLLWDQRYVSERKSETGSTLDDFTTSDVGVQYTFYNKKANINVYINNLFGTDYELTYGYPMMRQVYGVTLKLSF